MIAVYWSDLSALLSHYRSPEFGTWVCFFLSAMRCRKEWGLFMENNNTFVPTFLLTVCSRKNCGNVWTGIRRLAERQVSTSTETGLGTATKEQRLPLLDLNFFTEEPAVLYWWRKDWSYMCWPALYRIDQFVTTRKLSDIVMHEHLSGDMWLSWHFRDRRASQLCSVTETASQWLFLAL